MPWIEQQLIADGVTAEGRIVTAKAILEIIVNSQVITLAVNVGGTGYVVGETFDIVGGTAIAVNGSSIVARGRVVTEAAGVVTGVEILSAGAYSTLPGVSAIATTNSSAAGNDDLTVDLTTQVPQWTQDSSDYVDLLTDFEWLATSIKATNTPTVGQQTILSASNDSLRLVAASGYDVGQTFLSQPGAPPTNEFYVNVPNSAPQIYVSVTERRVNFMISDGTFKQYGGFGLFIPITDVAGNYPFPGFVHGQTRTVQAFNAVFSTTNRGLVHPINLTAGQVGPYQYRNNLSTEWFGISEQNNDGNDVARAQLWPEVAAVADYEFNNAPVPAGSLATAGQMDPFASSVQAGSIEENLWFESDAVGGEVGSQGPQPLGPGSQLHFTVVPHIISNKLNESMVIGYIDGWEAVHGRGLAAFDEIATAAGRRYLVFNDTNGASVARWVAMEKL